MIVRLFLFCLLLSGLAMPLSGCANFSASGDTAGDSSHSPRDPDDPSILARPFTAEQIREEWIPGFKLTLLKETPSGKSWEHWRVLTANDEKAQIEFSSTDEAGNPLGDSVTQSSTWTQLRDHATFAADRATSQKVTRETPLGELAGCLYTLDDADSGTVTEFFFADSLPGAPVIMEVTAGGRTTLKMTQIERNRP